MKSIIEIRTALEGLVNAIDESFQDTESTYGIGTTKGLSTGFDYIDYLCGGFLPGELAIIGGIPSVGKTSFALNIIENIAVANKKSVLIISAEAKPEYLSMRLISSFGRVDINAIRTSNLSDDMWPRITSAIGVLSESQIYFGNIPRFDMDNINAAIDDACSNTKIDAILIDGIQNIRFKDAETKSTELASAARELKSIALEKDLFVISCSHLNRYLYQRPSKRPILSDLLGAGSVEHDADYVFFIHREEMFNPETPDMGTAEILLSKHRCGPTGTIRLCYFPIVH